MDVYDLGGGNFRKNYLNVGEVSKTSYTFGTIKEMGVERDDPLTLDGTCTVDLRGGGSVAGVPIFYHCRKGLFVDEEPSLSGNNSLAPGYMSFMPEKSVKVMMLNDRPDCVIAHGDHQVRPCPNFFKIKWKEWTPAYHEDVFDWRKIAEADASGEYHFNKQAHRLRGSRELMFGTTGFYYGDWLFRVGPILVIFSVASVLMPGPLTMAAYIWAAPYTKELEDDTIAEGRRRDENMDLFGIWNNPLTEVVWPGFTQQTDFTELMIRKYQTYSLASPRWLYTEIYYQDFFND